MIFEASIIIITICLLLYALQRKNESFSNFPKGPAGIPILGNLHQLGEEPYKWFVKLRKTHGDIFSLRLGSLRAIVLNNYNDIREANQNFSLCGKPCTADMLEYSGGTPLGVLVTSGRVWLEQRRFVLKTLREFGFGKKSMESHVHTEILELLDEFKILSKAQTPFATTHTFNTPVLNVIWTLMTGVRYSRDDPALHDAIESVTTFVAESRGFSIRLFFPWLGLICSKLPGSYSSLVQTTREKLKRIIRESISDHKMSFHQQEEPRDFIDVYLQQIFETTDTSSSFYGEQGLENLVMCAIDIFVAGSETISTTLSWLFLFLAIHPDKQKKLFQEIQQVVGSSRLPSLADKPKMPYTEAVISEVMRYSSMLPLLLPHCCTEDTTFKGFDIPKGTFILPNAYLAMQDPQIWGDPEIFRPERFLSHDEKSFVKHEAWIPFSLGKRVCIGLVLAQNELFLFTTSIFQRFRVGPHPENKEPLKVDYLKAVVLVPKPQNFVLHDRMNSED